LSAALPEIDSEVSRDRTKAAASGKRSGTYSYSLTGKQLIFDGFKTASGISGAVKTISAEGYNYAVVSSNIRLDLRSAFTELLKAQELVLLTEDIAKRRLQNLKLVKLRHEAGREHRGSLLTAEADFARAEFDIEQAKRSVSLAQRKLLKALGYDSFKAFTVKGEFFVEGQYEVRPDFEAIVYDTPFLRELMEKKDAARYGLRYEEADFVPKVYLNASTSGSDDALPPDRRGWTTGLSVSLPLFEGGSRIAEVSKARSKLNQAVADERSGRDGALVELEGAWKDLKDAIAYVDVQNKFLDAAKERAKIASAQYESGLTSFDDWVIIEDNLVNARKAYLNAQADMLTAEAYWIQAIGRYWGRP